MRPSNIYRRMGLALHKGTGIRLSADDVAELVFGDNAVGTAMSNVCGYPESPHDVQEHGPKPASEAEKIEREYYWEAADD